MLFSLSLSKLPVLPAACATFCSIASRLSSHCSLPYALLLARGFPVLLELATISDTLSHVRG